MRLSNIRKLALAATLAIGASQAFAQEAAKTADSADAGELLFNKKCAQCHSLADGKNGNGPSLYGVVNRAAAVAPGFKYSRALQRMAADESLIWDEENLAAFLTRPSLLVPGTRMAFPGMGNAKDLAVLLEWVKANSGPPSREP